MRGSRYGAALLAGISILLYIYLSYFLDRSSFGLLMLTISTLFLAYYFLYQELSRKWKLGVGLGVLFRCLLLFSFPNLSDDIHRFVWDGNLIVEGMSPFEQLPSEVLGENESSRNDEALFESLNSKEYYSVYPPVCQSVFYAAAVLFPAKIGGRVFLLKFFLLCCEVGSILLLVRLLSAFSMEPHFVLLYALNPLCIIDIVGNVHFEGAMIFFLLLAIYLLQKNKWMPSAVAMALAVCSKLLPLALLPFLWRKLKFPTFVFYSILVIGLTLLYFLLFCPLDYFPHLLESINLYFQKFEFNASIYYVIRKIGYVIYDYNILYWIGKYLTLATTAFILIYALLNKKHGWSALPLNALFVLTIYLVMATIVHPWYIAPLVALATLTRFRFAVLWSYLAFLSYFAYSNPDYMENMFLIGLEYVLVFSYLFYELFYLPRISNQPT